MGAVMVNKGIAHNMNAALNHIPHEGLRLVPRTMRGFLLWPSELPHGHPPPELVSTPFRLRTS